MNVQLFDSKHNQTLKSDAWNHLPFVYFINVTGRQNESLLIQFDLHIYGKKKGIIKPTLSMQQSGLKPYLCYRECSSWMSGLWIQSSDGHRAGSPAPFSQSCTDADPQASPGSVLAGERTSPGIWEEVWDPEGTVKQRQYQNQSSWLAQTAGMHWEGVYSGFTAMSRSPFNYFACYLIERALQLHRHVELSQLC